MKEVKEYSAFNQRRYSDPWVAEMVDGKVDFKNRVGEYTGGYRTGKEGKLVVYKPVDEKVYAYGQKDNRGNSTERGYVIFRNDEFVEISREEALELC